jgi:hypothetical protein
MQANKAPVRLLQIKAATLHPSWLPSNSQKWTTFKLPLPPPPSSLAQAEFAIEIWGAKDFESDSAEMGPVASDFEMLSF